MKVVLFSDLGAFGQHTSKICSPTVQKALSNIVNGVLNQAHLTSAGVLHAAMEITGAWCNKSFLSEVDTNYIKGVLEIKTLASDLSKKLNSIFNVSLCAEMWKLYFEWPKEYSSKFASF